MDYRAFRREFDFSSSFPGAIADLKKSRKFRKMSLQEKYEEYDKLYNSYKIYYFYSQVPWKEKEAIKEAADQKIIERGMEIVEHSLQQ
ncbi:conserved hypothetical protein [Candidatus Desulfosporosinus infrequens]|uniref:Uncharacterized protein n=1 Tax=Candidatus Desulfosporosinus infrequens TaxID=2043169 RepID=A0A2U3LTU2_9FIRM|nr:conserved hypothetical protein [Candidatus Desulfosporosinus infrequens]